MNILRLTVPDLVAVMRCPAVLAEEWVDPLSGAAWMHGITNPSRMAAWLAVIAHESAGLTRLEENLNYSAPRLAQVWPTRFGPGKANANDYAHQPAKLANLVYANRMGNGPVESWEGWQYRGRGPIQITGKDNYKAAGEGININLLGFPDLMLEPSVGAMCAGWYWVTNNLNELADDEDFEGITRRVNGGLTDYNSRLAAWSQAKVAMARFNDDVA